jgi:hypothetical protein
MTMTAMGARASRHGDGDHAEDGRGGGHDDRAQADAAGLDEGLLDDGALEALAVGEVDQEDRGLGDQAHQHDEADER